MWRARDVSQWVGCLSQRKEALGSIARLNKVDVGVHICILHTSEVEAGRQVQSHPQLYIASLG